MAQHDDQHSHSHSNPTSGQGRSGPQGSESRPVQDQGATFARGTPGASGMERIKDVASSAAQQAQDYLGQSREMASNLEHRAEEALSTVGQQMQSLAGNLRQRAPQEGMLGTAASAVASTLETGGNYLQQQHLNDMVDDVSEVIRRYPLQSVLVGIGVGFCLARSFRS